MNDSDSEGDQLAQLVETLSTAQSQAMGLVEKGSLSPEITAKLVGLRVAVSIQVATEALRAISGPYVEDPHYPNVDAL